MRAPERIHVVDRVLGREGLGDNAKTAALGVAEAIFSTATGPPPPERVRWAVDELSDFVAQAGGRTRIILGASLAAIEVSAPLMAMKPPPFHRLSLEERVACLERFEASPLAMALLGVKTMLSLVWYEHPDAEAEIGYDRGCLGSEEPWR